MHVRPALHTDFDEYVRMRDQLWPQAMDVQRAEVDEWFGRADAVALVAVREDGSGLAGFAEVGTRSVVDEGETSPVAYLEGWYVDPDARRQGVGSALVRAAETWARKNGYREFASDVELHNTISQHAHTALGFRETSRVVNYIKSI